MIDGQPSRKAVPSASFGNISAMTLLVGMRFHMGMKHLPNSGSPKKNVTLYLYFVVGFSGLPPRPAYQDSQGTTVATHGTPWASHATATGLVVSGAELVTIMSTWW